MTRRQSDHIADALTRTGRVARIESQAELRAEVTGKAFNVSDYRNITIIPEVAQRVRSQQLAVVQGYADEPRFKDFSKYGRYAVVTTPGRIMPGGSIKTAHREICSKITKFFRYAFEEFDIELLLRASEFTVDDGKVDGVQVREPTWSVHHHHNILYWPHRALPTPEWSRFLREFQAALDEGRDDEVSVWWQDSDKIEDLRELVKYAFKPAQLEYAPDEVIGWLADELFRTQMVAFYNGLRHFKLAHKDQKYIVDNKAQAKTWAYRETRGSKARHETEESDEAELTEETRAAHVEAENVMLGRLSPMAKASPWKEPHTMFKKGTFTTEPKTDKGKENLAIFRQRQAEARRHWDLNGAPDPDTAINIGHAWLAAATDEDAEKITPFIIPAAQPDPEPGPEALYSVHNTTLTFPGGRTSSEEEQFKDADVIPIPAPIWSNGQWFDPETGELIEGSAEFGPAPPVVMEFFESQREIRGPRSGEYWKTQGGVRHAALADYWARGKQEMFYCSPFDMIDPDIELADFEQFRAEYDRLNPGAAGGRSSPRGANVEDAGVWDIEAAGFYYPGVENDCYILRGRVYTW